MRIHWEVDLFGQHAQLQQPACIKTANNNIPEQFCNCMLLRIEVETLSRHVVSIAKWMLSVNRKKGSALLYAVVLLLWQGEPIDWLVIDITRSSMYSIALSIYALYMQVCSRQRVSAFAFIAANSNYNQSENFAERGQLPRESVLVPMSAVFKMMSLGCDFSPRQPPMLIYRFGERL